MDSIICLILNPPLVGGVPGQGYLNQSVLQCRWNDLAGAEVTPLEHQIESGPTQMTWLLWSMEVVEGNSGRQPGCPKVTLCVSNRVSLRTTWRAVKTLITKAHTSVSVCFSGFCVGLKNLHF